MSIRGYLEDSNKKHFSMNVIENDFIKFYCLFSDITDKFVEKDIKKISFSLDIEYLEKEVD